MRKGNAKIGNQNKTNGRQVCKAPKRNPVVGYHVKKEMQHIAPPL
jgi:hypothetical protein